MEHQAVPLMRNSMIPKQWSDNFRRLAHAVYLGNNDLVNKIFSIINLNPDNNVVILQIAVKKSDIDMIKVILNHKPNFNLYTLMDTIWIAEELGCIDIVLLLINYGLTAYHYVGMYNSNLLHAAVERGNESEVVFLLNYGVDVDTRGLAGASALQYAVQLNQVNIVYRLLERGARIDLLNNKFNSILHTAARTGNPILVNLMLTRGADPKITNYKLKNTLHAAAESIYENVVIAEMLLKSGADLNGVDEMHLTPLHFALITRKMNMLKFFIEQGADVNAKTKTGVFPLYLAIEYTTSTIVELLLKKGAVVNEQTSQGLTALHIACKNGSERKIDILLNYGADINSKSDIVSTPLYWLNIHSKSSKSIIAKYVAELKFKNLFVCEENFAIIQVYSDWQTLYEEHLYELDRMTTTKIYNNISFNQIFVKTSYNLLSLLRNNDFIDAFESINLGEHFPLYEKDLNIKYEIAKKKRKQLDTFKTYLKSIFDQYLPDIVLERIMFYSSDVDI